MDWEDFESEYSDLARDVVAAGHQTYEYKLRDFVSFLDQSEWSRARVGQLESTADFHNWYDRCKQSTGGMVGSGTLDWARDRTRRLGQQLALFRHLSEQENAYLLFARSFLYAGRRFDENVHAINSQFFEPFVRDLLKDLKRNAPVETKGLQVPASDRIVRLDHNSPAYRDTIDILEKVERTTAESNMLAAEDPEERDRVVAELSAGRRLLQAVRVRSAVLWTLLSGVLLWLLKKFADQAFAPVIKRAIEFLAKLLPL